MMTTQKWFCSLFAAIGCAAGSSALGGEFTEPVFRPPLIQQVSAQQTIPQAAPSPPTVPATGEPQQVPTSRWDAQEPIQTPEAPLTGVGPNGCAACTTCYDPCLQFVVGVEATMFWPQISRSFLNTGFTNDLGSVDIVNNAALGSVEGGFLVGPRVTMGVQGECYGLVGRYWNSGTSANGFVPAFPDAIQSGVILFDTFNLYTVDLEVQRRFCWRNWDMFGFFGARYASVNNDRSLWIQNSFGDDLVQSSAFAGQQFNGAGVTFGVFGLRPLFCDDGALNAYFSNRYSILWGNGVSTVQTNASVLEGGGGFFESTDGALAGGDGDLFIVELGAGLQWEACLSCLPGRAFFRLGVEWQYWDGNAGVYTASGSEAGTTSGLSSYGFTEAGDLLFDLVGITLGAGLTY